MLLMNTLRKCQLVRILWRSNYSPFWMPGLDNFMTIHEDWVETEYVLANNNVTLQGVNRTHAWFCVTNPSVDVYSPDFLPFVFANQFVMADKLVIVSLDVLHQMAGFLHNCVQNRLFEILCLFKILLEIPAFQLPF